MTLWVYSLDSRSAYPSFYKLIFLLLYLIIVTEKKPAQGKRILCFSDPLKDMETLIDFYVIVMLL